MSVYYRCLCGKASENQSCACGCKLVAHYMEKIEVTVWVDSGFQVVGDLTRCSGCLQSRTAIEAKNEPMDLSAVP